jgi:hypothetical protein
MFAGIFTFLAALLAFIGRVWDWVNGRPKQKLIERRIVLEEESRSAQLIGDLDALRKVRAEINDIDRRLVSGDY